MNGAFSEVLVVIGDVDVEDVKAASICVENSTHEFIEVFLRKETSKYFPLISPAEFVQATSNGFKVS